MRLRGGTLALAWFLSGLLGCAHPERRFPLREPLARDSDTAHVYVACRPDPSEKDPHHKACAPAFVPNPLIWDGLDNMLFRPLSESLRLARDGESVDVNSMDEVPDSSWFTNRIGIRPMTAEELDVGSCTKELLLDGKNAPDASWLIDKGKDNGATDGFRVVIPGKGKFLFKADGEDAPEHESAAQAVGLRIFHAMGYFVPCDQIVYFKPSVFKLKPGLKWKHNFQGDEIFGKAQLDQILGHLPKRDGLIRMIASSWIPGVALGGFQYQGTRGDDPNDVIPHENRRELRGKRLVDAWIDRFDERRGNTYDSWVAANPEAPDSSPGHVVHYSMDTSESLGSDYDIEEITKRLGYSYIWDWGDIGADFVTLGTRRNVWEHVQKEPGHELFFYMNVKDFKPDAWKDEYPVAAFSRMTERDGAWAARILARFTPDNVKELARVAQFTREDETRYLAELLEGRLEKILNRYLTRVSPITEAHVEGRSALCGTDLLEWRGLRPPGSFRYTARVLGHGWAQVQRRPGGELCVYLPHVAPDGRMVDDAPERYVRVRIEDGVAKGPLMAYLYDLGPTRGYRLAGLERPYD